MPAVDLEGFELHERVQFLAGRIMTVFPYATFRPAGPTTAQDLLELLKKTMTACQESRLTRVLVDITRLTHKPFTTIDRFQFASGLAASWDRGIKLAIAGREDQVDQEGFGVLVAKNRGLYVGVYTSEGEALTWLLKGGPPKVPSPQ